jgi:hypothetical protein
MAFPTNSTVLDNFNRANGGPGTNWSNYYGDSACAIVSNALTGIASSYGGSYWNVTTFGPDCEIYYDVPTAAAGDALNLVARGANMGGGSPNGYTIYITPNTGVWTFGRLDAGAFTQLGATVTQVVSNADAVGMSVVGSTITAYYKASGGSWTSIATRTDTTYSAAGNFGFELQNATLRIDNFSGGTVVAGPTILLLNQFPNTLVRM